MCPALHSTENAMGACLLLGSGFTHRGQDFSAFSLYINLTPAF